MKTETQFIFNTIIFSSRPSVSLLSKDSLTLEEANIRWQTYDGRKPVDDDLGCGMFSLLASQLGLGCQVVCNMYIVLTIYS